AVLAVPAPDEAVGMPWGVAVFDSRAGKQCAYVGQVRGTTLGLVRGGEFHAFAGPTSAACAKLARGGVLWALKPFPTTKPRRVLAFGRVGAGATRVRAQVGSLTRSADVGPGGAFLFVFDGNADVQHARITALDAD